MSEAVEDLRRRVLETIASHGMLRRGEAVLCAVSGGPDSMCLLDVLHALGWEVHVAHLDHGTRHGQSAADAEFVRQIALDYRAPFHLERRAIAEERVESSMSFEEYARNVRYEFLIRVAREQGCPVIATGHHADDAVETMLMRILRGTTPGGLTGIPPIRDQEGIRIVRPLIDCTRESIADYARGRRLPYRSDSSNSDFDYVRNRIRLRLVPQLTREYNTRLREALLRLAEVQRFENDLLEDVSAQHLERCLHSENLIDRDLFSDGHPAIQRRAIVQLGRRHGVACTFERVNEAVAFIAKAGVGQVMDLGGAVRLRNSRKDTQIFAREPDEPEPAVLMNVPGDTYAFGKRFHCRLLERVPDGSLAAYCSDTRQVLDYERAGGSLWIRHWRDGDRIRPFGMDGTRKLQDYFVDRGVPTWQRRHVPLIVSADVILWVVGHGIHAVAAVMSDTRKLLEIEVFDAPE